MKFRVGDREILVEGYPVGLTLFLAALAVIYYVSVIGAEYGPESVLFIRPVLVLLLICGAGIIVQGIRVHPLREGGREAEPREIIFTRKRKYFLVLIIAYAALLGPLGFFLPTLVFLLLAPAGLGIRNWKIVITFSVGLTIFYVFLFSYLFSVPVPLWPGQD